MEINSTELQEKINKGEKMIVDFYANWCGPCKVMKPIYEKVSSDLKSSNSDVNLYTIDVDNNREIAQLMGIRSIPTIKVFSGGEVTTTKVGILQEGQLREMANNLING